MGGKESDTFLKVSIRYFQKTVIITLQKVIKFGQKDKNK